MKNFTALVIFSLFGIPILFAQNTIEVEITNFDSDKGAAFIGLYNAKDSFLKNEFKGEKAAIKNNRVRFSFKDIPDGVYAVSVFHDEDDSGDLSTNFLGIPKESYGASNNPSGVFGPPKWEHSKFKVGDATRVKIAIRL